MYDGYNFWKTVDKCNPYKTVRRLCEATGLEYWNTAQQRSKEIIPKAEALLIISKALNKSIEYLLTGEERMDYPPRIDAIARRCMYVATNEDLMLIERILRMPSDFEAVEKNTAEPKRSTSSGTA